MTLKLIPILRDGWLTDADVFGNLSIVIKIIISVMRSIGDISRPKPSNSSRNNSKLNVGTSASPTPGRSTTSKSAIAPPKSPTLSRASATTQAPAL